MPRLLLALFTFIAVTNVTSLWSQDSEQPSRWASAMAKFEAQDKSSPTKPAGVVFVGSSSTRLWNLDKSFPKAGYLNRGFGGSQIADSIEFANTLVLKHRPKIVVMYAGDNDIAAKKSPEKVAEDFRTFQKLLHKELPETQLIYIAIKPSLKRWDMWSKMKSANDQIAAQCQADARLSFADIITPMLNDEGTPRPGLFAKDGLHLNDAGYEVWTKVLKVELKQANERLSAPAAP